MTALPDGLTTGTWTLDPTHSAASFTVRHAGISKVRGQFTELEGSLKVGETLEDSTIEATIQVASITTGNQQRDDHLRSTDFFAAEQFPTIRFVSTKITDDELVGELTMHGVTKEVTLELDYAGAATDPFGVYRAGFEGSTTISRKEFGLTWNAALEAGGVLVSDEVKISIEAEFTAPTAA